MSATTTQFIKIAIVEGIANDFAVYAGPSDWDDQRVFSGGAKLKEDEARPILRGLRNCQLISNSYDDLDYRL